MITPDHNVPAHAVRREYQANRHVGVYYVWKKNDIFYWVANGNNGSEISETLAEEAARRWIRDGQ